MVDNTQSWQQQFSSYAEYANWYHHYYGHPSAGPCTPAAGVPTHATLTHPDVATAAATAAATPPTPYYSAYVAAPPQPHQHTPYAPPPTAVPPPVAASYYHPKPMIHPAPPIALSVPPPPLPPPPALPQTPPVIQHQGAYASGPPIPTYSATPHQPPTGVHSAAAYAQPYSTAGPHRYTGYTRTSAVLTAHPPASTAQQQQQQQTRVMHQLATQSKDPITKAVATNIVGVQKHRQTSGNNIGVKRSYNAMSTKKSGGSGTTGGSAPSGVIAGTSQRNKKQRKAPVPSVECPVCFIQLSSQQVYVTHVEGKAHKKKLLLREKEKTRSKEMSKATTNKIPAPVRMNDSSTSSIILANNIAPVRSDTIVEIKPPSSTEESIIAPPPAKKKKKSKNKNKREKAAALLGYGQGGSVSNQIIKPIISEKPKVLVGPIPDDLKSEDGPGVGKLLVGPNGPVDATAAAKVAAAGTMPNITVTTHSVTDVTTPVNTLTTNKNQEQASSSQQQQATKQCVLRCDCCSVTVNSQHQLDLHLNGVKHRKVINKLSKSLDPEDAMKLKKALDQAATCKAGGIKDAKEEEPVCCLKETKGSNPMSISNTSPQTQGKVEALKAANKCERNLPPGYVIISSNTPGQPDTFVCKVCQHSSRDVFSVNAHIQSEEHKQKSKSQERPLETTLTSQEKAPMSMTRFKQSFGSHVSAIRWKKQTTNPTKYKPLMGSFVAGTTMK